MSVWDPIIAPASEESGLPRQRQQHIYAAIFDWQIDNLVRSVRDRNRLDACSPVKASGQQKRILLRCENSWIKIHIGIVLECGDRDDASGFGLLKGNRCVWFLRRF